MDPQCHAESAECELDGEDWHFHCLGPNLQHPINLAVRTKELPHLRKIYLHRVSVGNRLNQLEDQRGYFPRFDNASARSRYL